MTYKKILTIQDISCVGQCSLTVALPILSACGMETAILPSAVLSTHTAGFTGYTCRDLTDDIPAIHEHWKRENIKFDAIYTGYLGSAKQIDYVLDIMAELSAKDCVKVVDPAMADNGALYPAFDMDYVLAMRKLCAGADIIVPNITEAAFLAGMEYKADFDEDYINALLKALRDIGAKIVVLTGVGRCGRTGFAIYENDCVEYYEHERIEKSYHGTGDVYSSAFVGALMNGKSVFDAAKVAADYTVKCIENTIDDPAHSYGVKFETALGQLMDMLK